MTVAHTRHALAVLAAISAACSPQLDVPDGAQVRCTATEQCPSGLVCVDDVGLCRHADDPCVDGTSAVRDGTPCGHGDQHCIAATCVDPFCGDGVVSGDEECDSALDVFCRRDTCTVPACGDGVLDFAEACDDAYDPNCVACGIACSDGIDVDGDPANACEATPAGLTLQEDMAFSLATPRDGGFTVFGAGFADVDGELFLVDDDGTQTQIALDLRVVDMEENSGDTFLTLRPPPALFYPPALSRVDGTSVTVLAETVETIGHLAVDEDDVWFVADGALARIARAGGEVEAPFATATPCADGPLTICGDAILCTVPALGDEPAKLVAFDRESGARTLLVDDVGAGVAGVACAGERVYWRDANVLGRVDLDGSDKRIVRAMASFAFAAPLFVRHPLVLWNAGSDVQAADETTGALRMVAGGQVLLAERRDELLFAGPTGGLTLVRVGF